MSSSSIECSFPARRLGGGLHGRYPLAVPGVRPELRWRAHAGADRTKIRGRHDDLAEGDQLQRLDKALAGNVLAQKTAGAGRDCRRHVFSSLALRENDSFQPGCTCAYPANEVERALVAPLQTQQPQGRFS